MAISPKSSESAKQYQQVIALIDGIKKDNIAQFGELKKEFGGFSARIDGMDQRTTRLEKDKIERDAIEKYRDQHPEVAQKAFDIGQQGYNENTGSITINKDLLNALKILGFVITALATAIIGMKIK